MRPVNPIFKMVQRRAIMCGAPSCRILQSSAPATPGSWSARGPPRRQGARDGPESIWVEDGPGAQRCSVFCGGAGFAKRLPSVGQQFLDPPGRMGADSIENVAEVSLRIDIQFLARRAQAHQYGRRLASLVAPREQPVFPPERDGFERCARQAPLSSSRKPASRGRFSAAQ